MPSGGQPCKQPEDREAGRGQCRARPAPARVGLRSRRRASRAPGEHGRDVHGGQPGACPGQQAVDHALVDHVGGLYARVHQQHPGDERAETQTARPRARQADRCEGRGSQRERRPGERPAQVGAGVQDPAAGQRGDRAGRADEREQADPELGEPVSRPGQQEADRRPETAEGGESARSRQRPPPQHRLGPRDRQHPEHLVSVADAELGLAAGQRPAHGDRGQRHERGRGPVDRAPPGHLGQEPGKRARQQDADQHPAHQGADDPAALVVGGQRRGVGDEHLHDNGGEAGQQRQPAQHRQARRQRAAGQRRRGGGEHRREQRTPAQDVPGGHEKQQARRETQLGRGDEQRRGVLRRVQRRGDGVQQRLRVVDVPDGDRAGDRHQPHKTG